MSKLLHALIMACMVVTGLSAQSRPPVIIGGEDSRGSELGRFRSVLALSERVIVLERDAPFIKVFDLDGRLRQSLGRAGSGPGEYRSPTGITWDSAGQRVLVVDASNARVTTFAFGDSLATPRFLRLENVGVREICVMGGKLYGSDRNIPELLHELSIDGDRVLSVRKFGQRSTRHPLGKHPLVSTRVNDGPLYCDGTTGTMLIGSRMLGEVQEIDARTGRQRTIPVPGFAPMELSIVDDGRALQQRVPEAGMHLLDNILRGPDGPVVVLGKWRRQPEGDPLPVGYEVAGLSAGGITTRTTQRSMPVGYTRRGVVCTLMDPVPTVVLSPSRTCD